MPSAEGFNRLKDCRHGRMLYNINDKYIGRSLDLYGEYSEPEISLLKQLIRPSDTIVEVGAFIGTHTVPFAKATSGGGGVIAFEPQRLSFQTLCANIALNSLTNVRTFQYACGETQDTLFVPDIDPNIPENYGGLSLGQHQSGEQVAMIRLDDMDLGGCRFIKIDVEGMELEVLKGGRELIAHSTPVLYIENDREEKSDELIRYIASLGYRLYWHRPMLFSPDNFLGARGNVFENIASHNMLCVAKEANVEGLEPVVVP